MSQVQILQFSSVELAQNSSKIFYPNNTSLIINSQAELFENNLNIGSFVVNNSITTLKDNRKLLNANGTFVTPIGILEVLFTNITGPDIISNNQTVKASIVHSTGIYEKATEVTIQELDDNAKTSIVAIVF